MGAALQSPPITLIVIKQLLCLVHNGCLWLGEPIPITDILIHRITLLLHLRLNPAMAFGRKTSECDLTEWMKDKFNISKKPRGYSISNITDPMVKVATKIQAGKIMTKCRADEVSSPVMSLVVQCAKGGDDGGLSGAGNPPLWSLGQHPRKFCFWTLY